MIKSVIERRKVVFHHHRWMRLLRLTCGHHVLVSPYPSKVYLMDCRKCNRRKD